jgi:hypothetical protein
LQAAFADINIDKGRYVYSLVEPIASHAMEAQPSGSNINVTSEAGVSNLPRQEKGSAGSTALREANTYRSAFANVLPIVVGTILGAVLSFSVTVATSLIEDRRATEKARMERLEKLMALSHKTMEGALHANNIRLGIIARGPLGRSLSAEFQGLVGCLPPTYEMAAIAQLHFREFPDLLEHVIRVNHVCRDFTSSLYSDITQEKPPNFDPLNSALHTLRKRIVEIAAASR